MKKTTKIDSEWSFDIGDPFPFLWYYLAFVTSPLWISLIFMIVTGGNDG